MATPPASRIATMCCRPRSLSPPVTMMTFPSSGGIGLQDNLFRDFQDGVPDGDMRFLNPSRHAGRYDQHIVTVARAISTIATEEGDRHEPTGAASDERRHDIGRIPGGGQRHQDITPLAESFDHPGKVNVETVVVAAGRERRGI